MQGIFFYYKYENIFIILQTCTLESAILETKQIVKEKKKLQRTYISIDLKSFYASVECRERGLDPLDANLVVADERRTDKTICLAVTPSLKSYGIPGRGRLFEVKQRVQQINAARRFAAPGRQLCGSSCSYAQLQAEPQLALDFIIAPPRMAYYMEYSTRIYEIYLRYVAPEDIIVYSVDEVFMDVTQYFELYGLTARELAMRIILDVLRETGILKSEEGMSGKNFCIIGQKQLDEVGLKSGATEILSVEPVIAPSQTPVSNLFLCKNTNGKRYRFFERFCCKEWLQGGTSSGINAFVVCTIYFNLFCWQFYRNGKQMF